MAGFHLYDFILAVGVLVGDMPNLFFAKRALALRLVDPSRDALLVKDMLTAV
jgi:hypothetical protein